MLRRRNLYAVAIAASPGIAAIVAFAWVALSGGPEPRWIQFLGLAICASWLATPLIWSTNAFAHTRRGELMVDRNGVAIEGELVVPTSDIESAVIARRGWRAAAFVRMRIRGQRFVVELPASSEAEAGELVSILGFDAAHSELSFVSPAWPFRIGMFPAFSIYAMFAAIGAIVPAVLASPHNHGELTPLGELLGIGIAVTEVVAFFAVARRSARHVTIARTGITVRKGERERTFAWREVNQIVPWKGAMTRAGRALPAGLDLVVGDGERIPIFTAREGIRVGIMDRDIVAERIRELMSAAGESREEAETGEPGHAL